MRNEFGKVTKTSQKMGGDKLIGLRAATCALVALCAVSALADEIKTRTWTGNGADNLWTNPDNWEPSEVSGASYNNVFKLVPGERSMLTAWCFAFARTAAARMPSLTARCG